MPEAMPDPMAKWSPAPDWGAARLARPGFTAEPVGGLFQTLLSGNLAAALGSAALLGFWEIAPGSRYAARIARDRAMLVSPESPGLSTGWRPEGWAASDASDAYGVLKLAGAELRALVAEATAADPDLRSPSAAILFAGVPALLYRVAEDEARLHVEAGYLPYVWRWLETR